MDEFLFNGTNADLMWQMFALNGEIGYYMAYKRLSGEEQEKDPNP